MAAVHAGGVANGAVEAPAAAAAAAATSAAVEAAALTNGARPLLSAEEGRSIREDDGSKTSCKQWLVLFAFCLNTALNSFLSVNFAVITETTRDVLDASPDQVAWLYSGFLLTVAVGMFPGLILVTNCEGAALAFSVLANVSCTWVRWVGVRSRSYNVIFFSAVLNAAGAWVILPLPAQLSQMRFPPSWWTLTTSMAIQANYSGWLLGSVLPPALVTDGPSMERFMLVQALCSLPVVLGFLLFYRAPKYSERLQGEQTRIQHGESVLSGSGERNIFDAIDRTVSLNRTASNESVGQASEASAAIGHGHTRGSLKQFIRTLRRFPRFGMQVLAYGILGGVSFAVPGCDDALLEPHGFSAKKVATVNAVFLGCGIVSGLVLGAKCTARSYGIVLKTLFVLCTLALTALTVFDRVGALPDSKPRHLALTCALFSVIGVSSLGFIGLGIEAAALYPAGGAYVCFSIEALVQIFGALFNQFAPTLGGFMLLAIASWIATLLILFGYHRFSEGDSENFRRSEQAEARRDNIYDNGPQGISVPVQDEANRISQLRQKSPCSGSSPNPAG